VYVAIRAAVLATVVLGAASLVLYTRTPQALAVVLYVISMIPLWAVDNLGVVDVGTDKNGFFLPTPTGYAIGAVIFWCGLFVLIRAIWPKRLKPPPDTSLERTRDR
jgi:hypothetical protein